MQRTANRFEQWSAGVSALVAIVMLASVQAAAQYFPTVNRIPVLRITADNGNWLRSPCNHSISGVSASSVDTTTNIGAYWRINEVAATNVILYFKDPDSRIAIAYRWDYGHWQHADLNMSVAIDGVPTMAGYAHTLEWCFCESRAISDQWIGNPPTNSIRFTGATFIGATTVARPAQRPKTMVIFSDSVGSVPGNDLRSDVTLSDYYALQNAANAEVGLVQYPGQGLVNSANQEHVPNLARSFDQLWAGSRRAFDVRPDICIVDEGQYDKGASHITAAATIVRVAVGVKAKYTLVFADQFGYQSQACQQACRTLGQSAIYIDAKPGKSALDTINNAPKPSRLRTLVDAVYPRTHVAFKMDGPVVLPQPHPYVPPTTPLP